MHFSKAKLVEYFPGISEICGRCASIPPPHLVHIFWSYSKWTEFWKNLFKIMLKVLGTDVAPCPPIAISGVPLSYTEFTKKKWNLLYFASLITRKCILLHWKSPKPPADCSWQTGWGSGLDSEYPGKFYADMGTIRKSPHRQQLELRLWETSTTAAPWWQLHALV